MVSNNVNTRVPATDPVAGTFYIGFRSLTPPIPRHRQFPFGSFPQGGKSAVKGVYLDKIEITKVE